MRVLAFSTLALALISSGCGGGGGGDKAGKGDAGGTSARDGGPPRDAGPFTRPSPDGGGVREHGSVVGLVTDVRGNRLQGVTVSLAGQSAETADDGSFTLARVPAGSAQMLVAALAGHSTGRVPVEVLGGQEQLVKVLLQPTENAELADPSKGGMVMTPSGVQIDLPADAIVDADGNPVSGPVELQIALLNDRDEIVAAPGGLLAINPESASEDVTPLESFGMVEVTLTAGGEEVHIKEGAQVELVFPLAAHHPFADGDPIGLWHFDETEEVWKLVGEGVVEGDGFRALVSHFSWWNADQVMTKTCVTGRVLDASFEPIAGAQLVGEGRSYLGSTQTMSSSDGSYCMEMRVSSVVELSAVVTVGGATQALAVTVNTPRAMGNCGEPSSCFALQDLVAVDSQTQALCDPAACPQAMGEQACCKTDLGPCEFVVNGDCGGEQDGSWDSAPMTPGVEPIPGVPMPDPPSSSDAGTDAGTTDTGGTAGDPGGGTAGDGEGAGSGGSGGSGGAGGGEIDTDRCGDAIALLDFASVVGATTGTDLFNDWWESADCSSYRPGYDRTYALTVPPSTTLRARVTGQGMSLALSTDCSDVASSCAAEGTRVSFTTEGASQTVYLTVDNTALDAQGSFALSFLTTPPACGDGYIDDGEECDDGQPAASGDGCSAQCGQEPDFVCEQEGVPCRAIVCGDGIIDGSSDPSIGECGPSAQGEQCDDGNGGGDDGCSGSCAIEPGYVCSGTPSTCTERPAGDLCSNAFALGAGTYDLSGLASDFSFAGGPDMVLEAAVAEGQILRVTGTASFDGVLGAVDAARCSQGYWDSMPQPFVADQPFTIAFSPSAEQAPWGGGGSSGTLALIVAAESAGGMLQLDVSSVSVAAPICGDGYLSPGLSEQCDDGDVATGDGCDDLCQVESGYACPGGGSCRAITCGDGYTDWPSESCEDGNTSPGDGCGSDCNVEPGYLCDFGPIPAQCELRAAGDLCNNATVLSPALHSAEHTLAGMTSDMLGCTGCPVTAWFFVQQGAGELSTIIVDAAAFEGDILLQDGACPRSDGGAGGPGEPGQSNHFAPDQRGYVISRNDSGASRGLWFAILGGPGAGGFHLTTRTTAAGCGDGVIGAGESCDDMNAASGDGCGATCQLEGGAFECPTEGGPCVPVACGDGRLFQARADGFEECDDGNGIDSDGCTACQIDAGTLCEGQPSVCTPAASGAVCSNAVALSPGMSMRMIAPAPASCMGDPDCGSSQWLTTTLAPREVLDVQLSSDSMGDAELIALDSVGSYGCRDQHVVSQAWFGMGSGGFNLSNDQATPRTYFMRLRTWDEAGALVSLQVSKEIASLELCGSGTLDADEQCDDGGAMSGDGCGPTCARELGFLCTGEPSSCVAAPSSDLCENLQAITSGSYGLTGFSSDPTPGSGFGASRWLGGSVSPGFTVSLSVTTAATFGQLRIVDVGHGGCGAQAQVLFQGEVSADQPFALVHANTSRFPQSFAVQLAASDPDASFDLVYGQTPSGCGDGYVDSGGELGSPESCDDGDTLSSDGCAASCVVEAGYGCAGSPSVCTVRPEGDLCSDPLPLSVGDTDFAGFAPDYPGTSSQGFDGVLAIAVGAGQLLHLAGSADFDGSVGAGSAATCGDDAMMTGEPFSSGQAFDLVLDRGQLGLYDDAQSQVTVVVSGNSASFGTTLSLTTVSVFTPSCGDGLVSGSIGESCDDGGSAGGDGCSASCQTEPGWSCPPAGGACHLRVCGDGIVERSTNPCENAEHCDDGNDMGGDGCSSSCATELGYVCNGEPSSCVVPPPGDVCQTAGVLADGSYGLDGFTSDVDCYDVCGGNDRWLSVSVPAGSQLVVDATTNASDAALHLFDVSNGCDPVDLMRYGGEPLAAMMPAHLVWQNGGPSARTMAVVLEDASSSAGTTFMLTSVVEPIPMGGGGCMPGQVQACDGLSCVSASLLGNAICDAPLDCMQTMFDQGDCP